MGPCKPTLFKSQVYSTVLSVYLGKNQLILVQKYLIFTPELGFKLITRNGPRVCSYPRVWRSTPKVSGCRTGFHCSLQGLVSHPASLPSATECHGDSPKCPHTFLKSCLGNAVPPEESHCSWLPPVERYQPDPGTSSGF